MNRKVIYLKQFKWFIEGFQAISSEFNWYSCNSHTSYSVVNFLKHTKKTYMYILYIKITSNYYEKHKEKLQKETWERYQNLSKDKKENRQKKTWERYQNLTEGEKEKMHQYHYKHNKNLSKEQKQKQVDYMRNYYLEYKK